MGTGVSSSHFVSAVPSSSHSSPAPAWDPTQGRQFSTNFTSVSPFHRVQYFINCSSVCPLQGHKSCQQTCSSVGFSLSLSLSPRVHRSCQEPAPAQASHGVTDSYGHPPALAWCPPWAAGGYLLHCGPPWAGRGTACLTMVFSTGCMGISAPAPGAPPHPPSALTLVSAELILTQSHSSLQLQMPLCIWRRFIFFPFLTMVSRRCYHVTDRLGLGQQRVCLGTSWHWLYGTWGKLLAASQKSHPCSPPATKTLPCKPSTTTKVQAVQLKEMSCRPYLYISPSHLLSVTYISKSCLELFSAPLFNYR